MPCPERTLDCFAYGSQRRNLVSRQRLATVQKQLRSIWPDYQKPVDAQTLASKFSLDDLLRVARVDFDLTALLLLIGLKK